MPDKIFSLDGKKFVPVSLVEMSVPSDEHGTHVFRFKAKLATLAPRTAQTAAFILLEALDGKRKTSSVKRWLEEMSLFTRTVSEAMNGQPISTITLKMYLWYAAQKGASQEKLLRSALLWWVKQEAPGLDPKLADHLKTTAPPKPRGMIEVQNAKPSERPLSRQRVHALLDTVGELYLSKVFTPQDNLLWRMMISEAMRPSQMRLLRVGDAIVDRDDTGKLVCVRMNVPMVKQSGVSARDYMQEHRLSPALSQAVVDHLHFARSVLGEKVPQTWSMFCVRLGTNRESLSARSTSVHIGNLINFTRKKISKISADLDDSDLFNRRLKHTKLTDLAKAGAGLETLAYAGFQTSTISLVRYVNLTEEVFEDFEQRLDKTYAHIESAFRGRVVERTEATHADPEHRIADLDMDDDVGACADTPCEVLACLGCYGCPRFEAFIDGPHEQVEAVLVARRARAIASGMPAETVALNDRTLSAVRRVIQIIKGN